jgi:hypothetical protein
VCVCVCVLVCACMCNCLCVRARVFVCVLLCLMCARIFVCVLLSVSECFHVLHTPTGTNSYTLAYTEAFDATQNRFRTQGRLKDVNTVELFYFNSDVAYQYDVRSPSTTCHVTSFSTYPQNRMARPSARMFDFLGAQYTRSHGSCRQASATPRTASSSCWYVMPCYACDTDTANSTHTYLGQTRQARNLLADAWLVQTIRGFGGSTVVCTFFFDCDGEYHV